MLKCLFGIFAIVKIMFWLMHSWGLIKYNLGEKGKCLTSENNIQEKCIIQIVFDNSKYTKKFECLNNVGYMNDLSQS